MAKQTSRSAKAAQRTDTTTLLYNELALAWVISIIPFSIAFFLSVPAFSDSGPHLGIAFWSTFALFAGLQIAMTTAGSKRWNSGLRTISMVCLAILLLVPELFTMMAAEFVSPLLYIGVLIAIIKLTRRIIKQRQSNPPKSRGKG